MAAEIRVMHQHETTIQAKVVPGLVFCHDSQDFRSKVLLSTQGGRKTSAARILKKNGRLWNMPIPEGYELAMFSTEDPAIFCVPGDTTNLADCTRLNLYRKCLMADQAGVTFDLTTTKDCVCALPYRTFGDVAWHFLVALRSEGNLHWFLSKETFTLVNDDSKPTRRRKRTPANKTGNTGASTTSATANKQEECDVAQAQQAQQATAQQQQQAPAIVLGSYVYHRQAPNGPIGTVMEVDDTSSLAVVSWSTGSQIIYHVTDLMPAMPATQPPAPTPHMVSNTAPFSMGQQQQPTQPVLNLDSTWQQAEQHQHQQHQPMQTQGSLDMFVKEEEVVQAPFLSTPSDLPDLLPAHPSASTTFDTAPFSGFQMHQDQFTQQQQQHQLQQQQHQHQPLPDQQQQHQQHQQQQPFSAANLLELDPFATDDAFIPAYDDQPSMGMGNNFGGGFGVSMNTSGNASFGMGMDMDVESPPRPDYDMFSTAH